MDRLKWAKNEIEILKKAIPDTWGEAAKEMQIRLYDDVLEAVNALDRILESQGHSGMSYYELSYMLKRLMDNRPLSPITEDDEWEFVFESGDEGNRCKGYQCRRLSSLFKDVYEDGTITYSDTQRVICYDPRELTGGTFTNGFIRRLIDKMYPITLPYYPDGIYKVRVEDYLLFHSSDTDDFDTFYIKDVKLPNGKIKEIEKVYTCTPENEEWHEISKEEFNKVKEVKENE